VDVLVLIDQLEGLIENAKSVPLSKQLRLDRSEIYGLLDEMRTTIPDEVKQARWMVKERQEALDEAKREASRILTEARDQASRASGEMEVVRLAERRADELIADARRQRYSLLGEVDEWSDATLALLEANLENFLAAIRRGRERLQERSQETTVAGIRSDRTSEPA
jgi:F0F1-type ATP synthase membrane subunit b/b'